MITETKDMNDEITYTEAMLGMIISLFVIYAIYTFVLIVMASIYFF